MYIFIYGYIYTWYIYIYTYMYIHMFYNNIFESYRDILCDYCWWKVSTNRKPVIPMPSNAPGIAAKFWIEPRDPAKLGEGDLGPDAEVDHVNGGTLGP